MNSLTFRHFLIISLIVITILQGIYQVFDRRIIGFVLNNLFRYKAKLTFKEIEPLCFRKFQYFLLCVVNTMYISVLAYFVKTPFCGQRGIIKFMTIRQCKMNKRCLFGQFEMKTNSIWKSATLSSNRKNINLLKKWGLYD